MKRTFAGIICCFVILTGYIAYVIAERQIALQRFSHYNDSWSVSQTGTEYMRLQQRLAAYTLDMSEASRDELRLRLDIMISRLGLLQQGSINAFIQSDPRWQALIGKLADLLHTLDAQFDHLDRAEAGALLQSMDALNGPMMALASSSVEYDMNFVDSAQADVRRLHLIYTALAAGLIICGIGLILLLIRQNQLLNNAQTKMRQLTGDLHKASEDLQSQNRRLEHDAHHDALTGLPNRVLFRKSLKDRLAQAHANGTSAAVLLLDLDGFKEVNDTLGHDVGDALLQAVASRLTEIGKGDDLFCRLGGDEFAILSSNLSEEEACALAQRIIDEVGRPYSASERTVRVNTCIGIAFSHGETSTEELFKQGDLALYEAKALGPGHVQVFKPDMQERLYDQKSFEADLRDAIQNSELEVHYQPQVDASNRRIIGYEALSRWTHPTRGQVPPPEFIAVAEKTGLIHSLGQWVLDTACREAASWNEPLMIAVNLSPIQFHSPDLFGNVQASLEKSGLPPSRLELEITESVLLDRNEHTLDVLRRLKALGIQIAMDDFGTGYSSLGSLSSFPFDKIKIDRSFIHDVTSRPDAFAIVELIIGVGHRLKMSTIAEGIETEEQFVRLQQLGCDQVQGYLFGRPQPASALETLHGGPSGDAATALPPPRPPQ